MDNINITPFVKWAGGKRQLLHFIRERMPVKYNKYIEPFVGGGAVLFDITPKNAIINDINRALINTYTDIRNNPSDILSILEQYDIDIKEGRKEYYYSKRQHYNDKLIKSEYDIELSALFLFLNKHCFNGLYRVNSKGLFNVPYNNSIAASFNVQNIMRISNYLQNVVILNGDFENVCKLAIEGDFVFIDSPYAPINPTSFESYTKEGFDIESHIRLSKVFKELSDNGVYCMLTNHNTKLINELYYDYKRDVVDVKRFINSDSNNRTGTEVIITNYME